MEFTVFIKSLIVLFYCIVKLCWKGYVIFKKLVSMKPFVDVKFNLFDLSNSKSSQSFYIKTIFSLFSKQDQLERKANFNLIQAGAKRPPSSLSPVTSTNIGISVQTFWLSVLTFLPHWCKISRPYLVAVSTYWTWTKSTLQRKWFFWSNPYRIEVMIASLTEMLVTKLWSHDHIYIIIWTMWHNYVNNFMWTKIMTSLLLFQNTFVLRRPRVGIFADIIKIVTMFVKTVFKNSKKVLSCISSYSKISWFPVKKCWYQQNARGVSRDSYIYIYSFLW